MKRDDLVAVLAEAEIDPTAYSIGREMHEALCLTTESGSFHVFLSERGTRYEERVFVTEDAACVYFLKRLFQLWRFDGSRH